MAVSSHGIYAMPRDKSPNGKSSKTMLRHWELLSLLPLTGSGKTSKELTEALVDKNYSVTKRQVERDLLDLEGLTFLGIRCHDKGMPYGWTWPKEAREKALCATLGSAAAYASATRRNPLDQFLSPSHSLGLQDPAPFFGREWLFEELKARIDKTEASLLILRGVTGVGKSAFLSRLLQRSDHQVLAHYSCPTFGKLSPGDIVKEVTHTIASQLATLHTTVSSYLTGRLEAPDGLLQTCSPAELFRQLVVQSLEHMPRNPTQAIIVIDGLEACMSPDGGNSLLALFLEVKSDLPDWLRLVIGSRPIPALDHASSQLEIIDIDSGNPHHLADLQSFAEYRLAPRLTESKRSKQIEEILWTSQGSFLFLSALANSDDSALLKPGTLPGSLDEFYARSFARLFPDSAAYQTQHAPLLSLLAGKVRNVPESILCHVLNLSQRQLLRVLSPLLGQMILRQDNGYRLFHPSLMEWLGDPHRSSSFSVEQEGSKEISDWLTQRMCQSDWNDMPPTERQDCQNILPSVVSSGKAWNDSSTLLTLARILHKAYRYPAEAILIQRLLTLAERTPEDAIQHIQVLCQHAGNLRTLGNLEKAFEALECADSLARSKLTEPNATQINLCHQYGLTCYRHKDYGKAGEWFIRGVEIACQLPDSELKLAELLNNAGRMLSRLPERRGEAEKCLEESLELRQRILGADHPITGATLNNLGFLCSQSDRFADAESYYLRALAAKNSREDQFSEAISLAESNLGSLYLHMKAYDKAEEYLLSSLETREALYGASSIPVGKIIKKIAKVYEAQNRGEEAREILKRLDGPPTI